MVKETIKVGDRELQFGASALTPILYRNQWGRDLFKDLDSLDGDNGLENINHIAFVMYKQGNPEDETGYEEWLDGFALFDIPMAMPEFLKLWKLNAATTSKSKKK